MHRPYSSIHCGIFFQSQVIQLIHISQTNSNSKLKFVFRISADKSGYKYLFVNPLNNTGGFWMGMMSTSLAHFDLYCLSDFSEEKLLSAIDRVRVISLRLYFIVSHI